MMSSTKKKRVSKRHKSTWRKTDVKDVEDFLEEKRQEERVGKLENKEDGELFVDDRATVKLKRTGLTEKQKRKLNAKKPLRSIEVWNNTSKVQDPIVKRNTVKQRKSGRNIEEEICNPTKPRHIQANKDRLKYFARLDKKLEGKKEKQFMKDVWENNDPCDQIPMLKDPKGWVNKDLSRYTAAHILRRPIVKVHDGLRHRTTKAKNFEPPHPGTSYNPALTDHQELLKEVVKREEDIIKEEKHLKRVTTSMFSKVTPEEREKQRIKEMRLDTDDDDVGNVENQSENEESSLLTGNPSVENKKKTRQQRNKEQRHKELLKKQEEKRALKKQIADINRIKKLKCEVIVEEVKTSELMDRRKKTALEKKFQPKRLGRLKFKEPDVDINMAEDIAGNLRNVKPESSLIIDRFKNFQKRNILPVSVALGKQKPRKVKRFLRNSHKDPGISFDMLREQKKSLKKQQ